MPPRGDDWPAKTTAWETCRLTLEISGTARRPLERRARGQHVHVGTIKQALLGDAQLLHEIVSRDTTSLNRLAFRQDYLKFHEMAEPLHMVKVNPYVPN